MQFTPIINLVARVRDIYSVQNETDGSILKLAVHFILFIVSISIQSSLIWCTRYANRRRKLRRNFGPQ